MHAHTRTHIRYVLTGHMPAAIFLEVWCPAGAPMIRWDNISVGTSAPTLADDILRGGHTGGLLKEKVTGGI